VALGAGLEDDGAADEVGFGVLVVGFAVAVGFGVAVGLAVVGFGVVLVDVAFDVGAQADKPAAATPAPSMASTRRRGRSRLSSSEASSRACGELVTQRASAAIRTSFRVGTVTGL
jgi:hypothetical protein